MPADSTVVVRGLAQLDRAFAFAGKDVQKQLRVGLAEVAEPIRAEAEQLADSTIRNLGPGQPWTRMRAVARRNLVYVAPVERGTRTRRNPRSRRPNLADLLMGRAMEPALDHNIAQVEDRFNEMLARVGQDWERV